MGSVGHYKIVKAAIEQECDVPVLGYMKREMDIDIPSRHLGLIPAIERGELNPFFDKLAQLVMKQSISISYTDCRRQKPYPVELKYISNTRMKSVHCCRKRCGL